MEIRNEIRNLGNLPHDRTDLTSVKKREASDLPVDGISQPIKGDEDLARMKDLSTLNVHNAGAVLLSKDVGTRIHEVKSLLEKLSKGEEECEILFMDKNGSTGSTSVYDRNNDIFYTGLGDRGCQYLIAFNPDGSMRWMFSEEHMIGKPQLDNEGNIYVRSEDNLHKLSKEGKKATKHGRGRSRGRPREDISSPPRMRSISRED